MKNPNAPEAEALRSPEQIIADMLARDAETAEILEEIRGMFCESCELRQDRTRNEQLAHIEDW